MDYSAAQPVPPSPSAAPPPSLAPSDLPFAPPPLISVVLPVRGDVDAALRRIEAALAGTPHEIIAIYGDDADALDAADALPQRPPTLRLIRQEGPSFFATGAAAASGDVVVPLFEAAGEVTGGMAGERVDTEPLELIPALAASVRENAAAVAIASWPRGKGRLRWLDLLLAGVAGIGEGGGGVGGGWNPLSGFAAYAADFVERHLAELGDATPRAARLELAFAAQLERRAICTVHSAGPRVRIEEPSLRPLVPALRKALAAPLLVYGLWLVMTVAALALALRPMPAWTMRTADRFSEMQRMWAGAATNIGVLSLAVLALTLAVRRVRGRVRIADGFFSLVLLDPLFCARAAPFDRTLLAAGLLGLMAAAIVAMKRDKLRRYLAVTGLALALTLLSDAFAMMLPALAAWLVYMGYTQARSARARERAKGYVVLAAAEVCILLFGTILLYAPTMPPPARATLFSTVVSFAEFPLLVLAIAMLALGWRPVPVHGRATDTKAPRRRQAPPYFFGMLALLVGLLIMILNNFQPEGLPPPGADQTVLILCLLYVVSALHGPRRLQWIAPPLLLAAAASYAVFR